QIKAQEFAITRTGPSSNLVDHGPSLLLRATRDDHTCATSRQLERRLPADARVRASHEKRSVVQVPDRLSIRRRWRAPSGPPESSAIVRLPLRPMPVTVRAANIAAVADQQPPRRPFGS